MIVTCQECSTSFQLDESRIPASGARVRCSRCKHAFFLPNPGSSQAAAVQSVVEQVVQGTLGGTPEPTQDLPQPPRGGTAARPEPEEEDWQFSQEIRVAGDDEREEAPIEVGSAARPRPDSFDLTGDFGRGFDPETLEREETTPADPGASGRATKGAASKPEPVRDASSFGSIDDFSSLIEDDDLSIDLATGPESTPPASLASASAPSKAPARSGQRSAAGSTTVEDLGDPESWDLVGGEGARRATSKVAGLVRPAAPPRQTPSASPSRAAGLDLFGDTDLPPVRDDLDESTSQAGARWAAVGRLAGWTLTGLTVAFVFGLLIRPEWNRGGTEPQRLEIGAFVAETARAGWLESSRAGLLLVFEGELRNTGATPLPPIPLQLGLLDGAGHRLADPPLEIGAPLDEQTLREASRETLSARRAESVAAWTTKPLAPGEARRFVAVAPAADLPAAARRVALEAGRADRR